MTRWNWNPTQSNKKNKDKYFFKNMSATTGENTSPLFIFVKHFEFLLIVFSCQVSVYRKSMLISSLQFAKYLNVATAYLPSVHQCLTHLFFSGHPFFKWCLVIKLTFFVSNIKSLCYQYILICFQPEKFTKLNLVSNEWMRFLNRKWKHEKWLSEEGEKRSGKADEKKNATGWW